MGDHEHSWTGAGSVMGKGWDDAVYVSEVCHCGVTRLVRIHVKYAKEVADE